MRSSAVPVSVFVFGARRAGAALVGIASVRTPAEIVEPALFLEERRGCFIAGATCGKRTPQVAEVVAGVASFPLAVRGGHHSREERRAGGVVLRVEHYCGYGVLSVIVVDRPTGPVIAVGNGPFADIESEELVAPIDRLGDDGVANPAFDRQDQRSLADQPGLVKGAVASERSVFTTSIGLGPGHTVSPGADTALAPGHLYAQLPDRRQDEFVASGQVVLSKEQIGVAPSPGNHALAAVKFKLHVLRAALPRELADHRQILALAGGQQSQCVDLGRNAAAESGSCDAFAAGVEYSRGLGAVVGRRVAVGAHDRQLDRHALLHAFSPDDHLKQAASLLGFGLADGPAEAFASVVGKQSAASAEDHVAYRDRTVGRRTFVDFRHQDLSAADGLESIGPDPASHACGAKVPVMSLVYLAAGCQVGNRRSFPSRKTQIGAADQQNRHDNH